VTDLRPARPAPRFRTLQVARVLPLTTRMIRITLTGDELAGFATDGPASHVKLAFPAPGQERVTPPTVGPDGPVWPAGRPLMRTYTPRRFDPVHGELDIDFVLHADGGPAGSWAQRARPGDSVVLVGPKGSYLPDPRADWHLLAGDETALPAMATIVEALPPGIPALVLIEVADPDERIALDSKADLRITWLYRGAAVAGEPLELAVQAAELPTGEGRAFIAAEATAMRKIRRYLLGDGGLTRDQLYTRGYWKYGVENHPDHDTGED
jgi:NADPH-dependent ferric siderophore reductase